MTQQPWQMTRDEYVASFAGQRIEREAPYNRLGTLRYHHETAVDRARQTGLPIPAAVLKDYRDYLRGHTGRNTGSEAVAHFGGTLEVIRAGIRCRRFTRMPK